MPTTKTAAATVTDTQIRALRAEAKEAGDDVQVHVCSVALGDEEPVTDGAAFEERYGGAGFQRWEQSKIMSVETVDDARALCAEAINSASAMDDSE